MVVDFLVSTQLIGGPAAHISPTSLFVTFLLACMGGDDFFINQMPKVTEPLESGGRRLQEARVDVRKS